MNRFFTKLPLLGAVLLSLSVPAKAQFFDHLGANVQVGTNGISIEAVSNITQFVNIRAGVDFMPDIKFNADADFEYYDHFGNTGNYQGTMDLQGRLGRTQAHVIFNVYPVPKVPFYVAVGAYFSGNKLVKISGHSDEIKEQYEMYGDQMSGGVIIGNYNVPTNENGDVKGGIKVNGFRPYFGIGWGRTLPNKLVNFGIELGVQIQGKPKVYTDYGSLDSSEYEDNNTYQKIINKLKVYPVLSFRLGFKAF